MKSSLAVSSIILSLVFGYIAVDNQNKNNKVVPTLELFYNNTTGEFIYPDFNVSLEFSNLVFATPSDYQANLFDINTTKINDTSILYLVINLDIKSNYSCLAELYFRFDTNPTEGKQRVGFKSIQNIQNGTNNYNIYGITYIVRDIKHPEGCILLSNFSIDYEIILIL